MREFYLHASVFKNLAVVLFSFLLAIAHGWLGLGKISTFQYHIMDLLTLSKKYNDRNQKKGPLQTSPSKKDNKNGQANRQLPLHLIFNTSDFWLVFFYRFCILLKNLVAK